MVCRYYFPKRTNLSVTHRNIWTRLLGSSKPRKTLEFAIVMWHRPVEPASGTSTSISLFTHA